MGYDRCLDEGNQAIAFISSVLAGNGRAIGSQCGHERCDGREGDRDRIRISAQSAIRLPSKLGLPAWYTIQTEMCFLWHPQKTMPYLQFREPQREPAAEAKARLFTQMPFTCTVRSPWLRLPMAIYSLPTAT